ncbi:hypothetical protein MY4038_002461 [Beauveria bassiana]
MDDSFGPRLLGHFDFTLLFEHTMLHIIPASVIVFATPFYIYTLFHGTNVVRSGVLLWIKIFCALAMVGLQIANAVLWSQSALESQLAQAAAVMTSISAACMGIMVVVGHLYFPRPPSFLGLALTLTMIFDIGTTWTYFHRTGLESIARLHVPLPALKLVLIFLEEVSKRNLIRSKALRSSLGQEALAGFWNRSLLLWVNPLLLFGFRREITMNVLPGVGPHLEAELLYQHFRRRWDKTNQVSRWALIKACVLTMPWPFLYIILPRLLAVGFNFAQPFLLQDVVNAVASDTESPIGLIRGLILATTAIYVGKAVSKSWYIHLKNQIMIGVRGILISAIYHKSLKLPADDLAEAAAVTLMNVDVTGVTHLISLSYESWARLLEMGLGIGILAVFVGAATLFTIIPTVITSIGSAYVARHMIATRRKWNEHMQDRIAATSNILVQIKDIKMLGLNTVLSNRLQKQFESEIDVSMTNRHQIAATFGIGDFATAMTPVLVIAGTIFWTRASEPISVARFFTTLAVVTLVSSPLSAFVQTLSSWSSGFACLVRIQNYLNLSETEDARCFALQAGVVDTDDLLPGAVSQASSNLRNRQRLTTSVVPYPVEITRVSSLARTLYTQAELLVLDDPFSSLDRETSSTIRIRLFSESHYLADNASTIVMTTSMRQHLVDADAIYKLDDTGQVEIRSLEQIQTESESHHDIQSRRMGGQSTSQAELTAATAVPTEKEFEPPQVIPTASSGARDNLSNKKYGDFTLYKYFLRPAGLYCVILWLSSIAIAAVAEKMPRIYVRFWLADNPENRLYYIGYAGLGLIAPVLSYLQAAFFYFINIKSATSLHWALLDATNRATFEFLTEQDAGELLNRFSQDTSMATQELPMAIMPTIWGFVSLLIDVSIISSGATYATPIIPLFLFILFVLQHFYLRTSRQLRILELDSTKTLVSHSTESSTGIEHIRAFQMEEDFVRHLYRILDESQKPLYFLFAIQQWLISVMDFVTATAAVCIVSLALNFKKTTSASAMGLALLGLISFSDFTSQTVRFFVEMENTFGAVARIRDFARMTPKEEDEEKCEDVPDQWPLSGRVDLNCVSAMYKADTEKPHVALENITVTIQPGQTVGLIGRTGSGKTSVLLALLHLLEYTGSIHIDGRELRTIPRNLLRNRITTITQSGVEFGTSVRFNMDPLEFSSRPGNFPTDDTLAGILRRVGLWDHVLRHGGLGAEMRAMKFSVGQKQLFQLARAMLHRQITRSKLVLIDEGTASMDEDTEGRMFHLMREAFAGCTKIIISHREAVLADADLVLSLSDGRGEVYRPQ